MKFFSLSLLAFTLLCGGCFGTRPAPARYTLGLEDVLDQPIDLLAQASEIKVSLAPDLQALTLPYILHKDGKVTNDLTFSYYASVPLLLQRALETARSTMTPITPTKRLTIVVTDYYIDVREANPSVKVSLKVNGRLATASEPLPQAYEAAHVRQAFATALRRALQATP